MAKARDAFRTISEVSEWLDTPAHVLRFWESKFNQIKPVKRAGGRRYYRPDDMALLAGIKCLLHEQGMTIKGAQKMLREQGVKQVAALSPPIEGHTPEPNIKSDNNTIDAIADVVEPVIEATTAPVIHAMPPPMRPAPSDPAPVETVSPPPEPMVAESPVPVIDVVEDARQPADVTRHVIADLHAADPAIIRARAAEIAPLITRLQALRDRMHHP